MLLLLLEDDALCALCDHMRTVDVFKVLLLCKAFATSTVLSARALDEWLKLLHRGYRDGDKRIRMMTRLLELQQDFTSRPNGSSFSANVHRYGLAQSCWSKPLRTGAILLEATEAEQDRVIPSAANTSDMLYRHPHLFA